MDTRVTANFCHYLYIFIQVFLLLMYIWKLWGSYK